MGVEVTLVNDAPYLLYSGMTPEYVGGVYRSGEARVDLRGWCRKNRVRFVQSPASHLDVARRVLHTESGARVPFDLAVFNLGATNPLQERAGDAVFTKPLRHIERLVGWLEDVIERPQPTRSLVVVGGGPAGTEVMLNVSSRLKRSARPDALRLTPIPRPKTASCRSSDGGWGSGPRGCCARGGWRCVWAKRWRALRERGGAWSIV